MNISNKLMVLTGPIKSGKSSRLFDLFKERENAAGILSLVVDNKKHLYSIRTKERKLLEIDATEKDTTNLVKVGKYNFSEEVFAWGRKILSDDLKEKSRLIIIDEIGRLELAGKGLAPTAFKIINQSLSGGQKIIVVVRDSLLCKFLEHIKLKSPEVDYFSFDSF